MTKTWSVEVNRKDYPNAYNPWSEKEDKQLEQLTLESKN